MCYICAHQKFTVRTHVLAGCTSSSSLFEAFKKKKVPGYDFLFSNSLIDRRITIPSPACHLRPHLCDPLGGALPPSFRPLIIFSPTLSSKQILLLLNVKIFVEPVLVLTWRSRRASCHAEQEQATHNLESNESCEELT